LGERVLVACPFLVTMYQRYMRGVDVFDQLRSYCSIGAVFNTRRFWLALYINIFDTALTNMYIIWREFHGGKNQTSKSKFMRALHVALLTKGVSYYMKHFVSKYDELMSPQKEQGGRGAGRKGPAQKIDFSEGAGVHPPIPNNGCKKYCAVHLLAFDIKLSVKSGCGG
jgi:hypothetical protein